MKIIQTQNYERLLEAQLKPDAQKTPTIDDLNDDYHVEPKTPPNLATEGFQEPPEQNELPPQEEELPIITPDDFIGKEEDEQQDNISEEEPIEEPLNYPVFPTTFQALRWAKYNNETVRITYTTLSGRTIVRDVEPVGDFMPKTTHRRNVATFDATINDIRTFIISGISKYQFTGEKFSPKFNFSQSRKNYRRRIKRKLDKRK